MEAKKLRMREKSAQIIVSSLVNVSFRVIDPAMDHPAQMMKQLDDRYASARASSRISVMTSLYRTRYTGDSMAHHCDKISSMLNLSLIHI